MAVSSAGSRQHALPDAIADAGDPEAKRQERWTSSATRANPYGPAKRGYLDDVIEPTETRKRLIQDLDLLQRKREDTPPKDHGNIPL